MKESKKWQDRTKNKIEKLKNSKKNSNNYKNEDQVMMFRNNRTI